MYVPFSWSGHELNVRYSKKCINFATSQSKQPVQCIGRHPRKGRLFLCIAGLIYIYVMNICLWFSEHVAKWTGLLFLCWPTWETVLSFGCCITVMSRWKERCGQSRSTLWYLSCVLQDIAWYIEVSQTENCQFCLTSGQGATALKVSFMWWVRKWTASCK